jgi:hypothetical protein
MSERERWVVYPLLFLALGASLRDKLIDQTTSRVIVCQELQVVDDDLSGRRQRNILARIGPASIDGESLIGALEVDGVVQVNGPLQVDGTILAKNYSRSAAGSLESLLRELRRALSAPREQEANGRDVPNEAIESPANESIRSGDRQDESNRESAAGPVERRL